MGEGHRQRLFEKYYRGGLLALCEEEIIEILLFLAIPRKDTHPIAEELISKFGGLVGILEADRSELESVNGIGNRSAITISFMRDLLFYYRRDKRKYFRKENYVEDIGSFLADTFGNEEKEFIFVIYIDEKNRMRGYDVFSDGESLYAKLDFVKAEKRAKELGVNRIVIAHNHPSGVAIPSLADLSFTVMAKNYFESMNLEFVDHIIFESNDSVSLVSSFDLSSDEALEEIYGDWVKKRFSEK